MTTNAEDGQPRCDWAFAAPDFLHYHDTEWGFPVQDDSRLFEKLSLEAFQAGLSWRTILSKRDNLRRAFHNFDVARVAAMDELEVARLLEDEGIIRHRGKIEAVINNAKHFDALVGTGTLAEFVWSYQPEAHRYTGASTSPESFALAKRMKKAGWKFVGPTTVYAFMQAMGLINDHEPACIVGQRIASQG